MGLNLSSSGISSEEIPDQYRHPGPHPIFGDKMSADLDSLKKHLKAMQDEIHATAVNSGWWESLDSLNKLVEAHGAEFGVDKKEPNVLYRTAKSMLAVSEIAEGVEALRNGDANDDKLTHLNGQAVEIADDIIRQLDLAARFNLPVIDAIIEKMKYNKTRPHRHGGKSI